MNSSGKLKWAAFSVVIAINLLALVGYFSGPMNLGSGSIRDLWPAVPMLTLVGMAFVGWATGRRID